jgi:hypothetical protein
LQEKTPVPECTQAERDFLAAFFAATSGKERGAAMAEARSRIALERLGPEVVESAIRARMDRKDAARKEQVIWDRINELWPHWLDSPKFGEKQNDIYGYVDEQADIRLGLKQ